MRRVEELLKATEGVQMSTEGHDLIVDLVKTRKMSPLVANPLMMVLKAVEQVMLEHGLRLASDKVPGA